MFKNLRESTQQVSIEMIFTRLDIFFMRLKVLSFYVLKCFSIRQEMSFLFFGYFNFKIAAIVVKDSSLRAEENDMLEMQMSLQISFYKTSWLILEGMETISEI